MAAGKLPKHNNVSWRGNSCLQDGKSDSSSISKDLIGGYYDAGDAIKFHFPQAFAMTMLSWSVIEYSAKYESAGELNHVKDIIKWGTDYFLKTFNHSADSISRMVAQVLASLIFSGSLPSLGCSCIYLASDFDRLDQGIHLEGVQLRMITIAGHDLRILTMTDLLQNAVVALILLLRWLPLWHLHLLFSKTIRPIRRNWCMVPKLFLSSPGISAADTVLVAPRQRYSIIPLVTGMSLFGVVLGCIMQLGTIPISSLLLLLV